MCITRKLRIFQRVAAFAASVFSGASELASCQPQLFVQFHTEGDRCLESATRINISQWPPFLCFSLNFNGNNSEISTDNRVSSLLGFFNIYV